MTNTAIEWDFDSPSRMVGAEIRAELARQGQSQRQLAEQLVVNQAWVSRRISPMSDVEITLEEVARIAIALKVPIQRFLSVWLAESPSTLVRSYLTLLPEVEAEVIDLDVFRLERAS